MTNAKQILAGLSLAVAAGAVNATPPKTEPPCKTGCGGTTTPAAPAQTTNVTVGNNIDLTVKPVANATSASTSASTSSAGVAIESGAIRSEGGKGGDAAINAPINVQGGSQSLTIKDRLQAPGVAPAGLGTVIVGGGVGGSGTTSPEARCAAMAMGGSGWSVGGSVPGAGLTITRQPGLVGYQVVDEDGKYNGELATKFAVCVEKETEYDRVMRTVKIVPGIVLANDLRNSPELESGRAAVAQYKNCPDQIAAIVNGGCTIPAAASSVTEKNKTFSNAALGAPQPPAAPKTDCPPRYTWNAISLKCEGN